MDPFFGLSPALFAAACAVGFTAGFVKGVVGFALPLVMISGLTLFLPIETALAGLLISTLLTNIAQALGQGLAVALGLARRYWRLLAGVSVAAVLSAPLVVWLPARVLYAVLGVPILLFTVTQLMGHQLVLPVRQRARAELLAGAASGFFGGIAGVWAPPVVTYLLSFNTEKREMIRIMGVSFTLGTFLLIIAHTGTGILNAATAPFSAVLVAPVALGMWVGGRVQNRLEPESFRKATLLMLALIAVNLLRRAALG